MENPQKYLHVAVSETLRSRIDNRELPPGSLLAGENSLANEFGVSRSVIRQALGTLREEGLVESIPGRGTMVCGVEEWHRDAQRTAGLSAQMRALGARVQTRVMRYELAEAKEPHKNLNSSTVLILERLRYLDGEPVAFIRTWLPSKIAEDVSKSDLEDASLHTLMAAQCGIRIQGGNRQIYAVTAGAEMSSRLQVKETSPVLLLEGESYDDSGRAVEHFSTWHRSDRFSLDIQVYSGTAPPKFSSYAVDEPLESIEKQLEQVLTQLRRFKNSEQE